MSSFARALVFATAILAASSVVAAPAVARAPVAAAGTATPIEAGAEVVVRTTGTVPVDCLRFRAPPDTRVTGVTGPGTIAVEPDGFSVSALALPPGGTARWTLTTGMAYPADGAAALAVSATCAPGSDVPASVGRGPVPDPRILSVTARALEAAFPQEDTDVLPLGDATTRLIRGDNDSTAPAVGVVVSIRVGQGFAVRRATFAVSHGEQGTCEIRPERNVSRVTCSIGTLRGLENGIRDRFSVLLTGTNTNGGIQRTEAALGSLSPDGSATNNAGSKTVALYPAPDSSIGSVEIAEALEIFGSATATSDPLQGARNGLRFNRRLARVALVELAILRLDVPGCRWLADRGSHRFVRRARERGQCPRGVWLRGRGTTRWRFTLPNGLPRGRYLILSRAVNAAGIFETRFSARDGNRRVVTVR